MLQVHYYRAKPVLSNVLITFLCAKVCKSLLGGKIVKETVTVVQDFGVQLYSYNLAGKVCASRFVDLARVRDVILNESMSYWQLD